MKELKHIKVFEAFESKILSKTLGYIKEPNDKEKFFNQIKRICDTISYPLSKMSDEYFEYLPFKSALSKANKTGDEPCEATSVREFPGYGIEGAKCENGKIKRRWGSRVREVVCPVCSGTGIKPKKSELKLLKFWFDSNGKYIIPTLVDGTSTNSEIQKGDPMNTETNPYSWNFPCNFSYHSISPNKYVDTRGILKDAHFAIILDFGKLKKSDYVSVDSTKSSREERKEGSKLDPRQSDVEIKKRNIERYINILSQKLDIPSNIANCNKLLSRSLGNRSALYVIVNTEIYSHLTTLIHDYIRLMKSTDDFSKKGYAEDISERVNNLIKRGTKASQDFYNTIDAVKLKLKENNNDERYFEIINMLQKSSDVIFNNIKNYQIDSIEDLEIVTQKIGSIKNIIKSERHGLSRLFNYFFEYLRTDKEDLAYRYLTGNYYDIDEVMVSLPRFLNLVSKI